MIFSLETNQNLYNLTKTPSIPGYTELQLINEVPDIQINGPFRCTGKSLSEALFFASTIHNKTKDCSLIYQLNTWQLQVQNILCTWIVFYFCFDIQNNICTKHVLDLYFSRDSVNNVLSYCGLTDSRMRASETDLPVLYYKLICMRLKSFFKTLRHTCSALFHLQITSQ